MAGSDSVPGDDPISDDSDFYGTAKLRKKLEARSKNVNTLQLARDWAKNRMALPTTSVAISRPTQQVLHNPMEGSLSARQLNESADDFLKRLPPRSTSSFHCGPWIWVMNPIVKGKGKTIPSRDPADGEETPLNRLAGAFTLLAQFDSEQERIKGQNPGAAQSSITRKLGPLRDKLKEDILDLAVLDDLTAGKVHGSSYFPVTDLLISTKWMLFPKPQDVNRVWRIVVEAVIDGRLGDGAKVATYDPPDVLVVGAGVEPSPPSRLICVYTKDFSDLEDVRRVLHELVELGLSPRRDEKGAIYYKCDAFTHLGLDSKNKYGLKASLYSSKDLLGTSGTLKRKSQEGNERKVVEGKKRKTDV